MELSLEEIDRIKKATAKSNEMQFDRGMNFYRCPICDKRFIIEDRDRWTYKRRRYSFKYKNVLLYMCSYGCLRKYDVAYGNVKN